MKSAAFLGKHWNKPNGKGQKSSGNVQNNKKCFHGCYYLGDRMCCCNHESVPKYQVRKLFISSFPDEATVGKSEMKKKKSEMKKGLYNQQSIVKS